MKHLLIAAIIVVVSGCATEYSGYDTEREVALNRELASVIPQDDAIRMIEEMRVEKIQSGKLSDAQQLNSCLVRQIGGSWGLITAAELYAYPNSKKVVPFAEARIYGAFEEKKSSGWVSMESSGVGYFLAVQADNALSNSFKGKMGNCTIHSLTREELDLMTQALLSLGVR